MAIPLVRHKPALARLACDLIGSDAIIDLRPDSGWPSLLKIQTGSKIRRVAFHVSNVGTHSRKSYERRFQNPADGTPASAPEGWLPLLVGVSLGPPSILVVADGRPRVGISTRYPVLFHERVLREAAANGWSTYTSATGERVYGMNPTLFPVAVEMIAANDFPPDSEIAEATLASGLLDNDDDAAIMRARRSALVLVRAAGFSRKVRGAYNERCGICGLGVDLVEGAHILPASVPGSQDKVWNGVALCRNHHKLFDLHRLWIEPETFAIKLHPEIIALASTDPVVQTLRRGTFPFLQMPASTSNHPRTQMIIRRHEFFRDRYGWLP